MLRHFGSQRQQFFHNKHGCHNKNYTGKKKYITIVNRDIALGVSFFNGDLSINDVLNIVNTL